LSKSCQKIVQKLSKNCKKLSKSFKKLTKVNQIKSNQNVSLVILCDMGSHLKEKIYKRGGWVGVENSSSKAFGISFADRPKAKTDGQSVFGICMENRSVSVSVSVSRWALGVGLFSFTLCEAHWLDNFKITLTLNLYVVFKEFFVGEGFGLQLGSRPHRCCTIFACKIIQHDGPLKRNQ
jgi:hypothetical protein